VAAHSLNLLLQLTAREFQSRFAGSVLGAFWAFANPAIQLAIYTFVFGQLLRAQIGDLGAASYAQFVALGLWPWLMFSDGVMRGMLALQQNAELIRKVAFPRFYLVLAAVNSAFALHLIGYATALVLLGLTGTPVGLSGIVTVIALVLLLYVVALGLAMALSVIHVLVRDTEQAIGPALTMLYFLTPVLYPATILPEEFRRYLHWNPLATIVAMIREAWLEVPLQTPQLIGAILPVAAVFLVGALTYARLKPHLEDYA
jgi:ABC-type polysaccharide/polyol phosphate export permease